MSEAERVLLWIYGIGTFLTLCVLLVYVFIYIAT